MRSVETVVRDYLTSIKRLNINLGPGDEPPVTGKDNERLVRHLRSQTQANNKLISLAAVLLCLAFILVGFLVIYNRNSATAIAAFFSGNFLAMLAIVKLLHRLWVDRNKTAVLLYFVQKLPPDKAADFTNEFYWNFMDTRLRRQDKKRKRNKR